LLEEALGEPLRVVGLKYVFVLKIAENLDDFVELFYDFLFAGLRYLGLKLLVQERYECFRRLLVLLVDDVLKRELHRQVNLTVTRHRLRVNPKNSLPQRD